MLPTSTIVPDGRVDETLDIVESHRYAKLYSRLTSPIVFANDMSMLMICYRSDRPKHRAVIRVWLNEVEFGIVDKVIDAIEDESQVLPFPV